MNMLDSQAIEIPCPHCRHKVTQTIAQLKRNPQLTCSACAKGFAVNANELRISIEKIEKSLANLQRTIGRLGK